MIIVDLENKDSRPSILHENIGLKLPVHRKFLGMFQTNIRSVEIKVQLLSHPHIVLDESKDLLLLVGNGTEAPQLSFEDISDNTIHFDVLLDTKAIRDCDEMENGDTHRKLYPISYRIEYKLAGDTQNRWMTNPETGNEVFTNDIQFAPARQEALVRFDTDGIEPIVYQENCTEPVLCGVLDFTLKNNKRRAPLLDLEFALSLSRKDGSEEKVPSDASSHPIVFIDKDKIEDVNGIIPIAGTNLQPMGNVPESDILKENVYSSLPYAIRPFMANPQQKRHVRVPVMLNLSAVRNPREENELYRLYVKGKQSDWREEEKKWERSFEFLIHRNTQHADLEVAVSVPSACATPDECILLANGEQRENGFESHEIVIRRESEAIRTFYLKIRNTADAIREDVPHAGIRIKNFRLSEIRFPDDTTVCYMDDANEAFRISSPQIIQANQLNHLSFGQEECITIEYLPRRISGFQKNKERCFESVARCTLAFDYLIDIDGSKMSPNEDEFHHFETVLSFPLSVAPAPNWMCIDFGTSAVVAEYGEGDNNENGDLADNRYNLKERKTELLKATFSREDEWVKRTDNNESDTSFISSVCAFNDMCKEPNNLSVPSAKDYKNGSLWFSPSTAMYNVNYQLPYLKSLMGYKVLPRGLFSEEFEKQLRGKDGEVVDKLYEAIYRQLFSYYMPDDADVEKLVLSYPNTFAPVHLDILRNIALSCCPRLRNLRLISESDAVAYYYLSRRRSILVSGGFAKQTWSHIDHHTLIYDMGGGTLDLTYFKKEENGQTTHIDIIGKLGSNKAGNYIDYLIGEILTDILEKRGEEQAKRMKALLEIKRKTSLKNITNTERNKFKTYLRDAVKPSLAHPENELAPWTENGNANMMAGIHGNDILQHALFQDFLKDISDGMLNCLTTLYGQDEKLPLNLVIFSGRSTSLPVIRQEIMRAIQKYNTEKMCRFVDIAAEQFIDENNPVPSGNINRLKSVVAAGARIYPTLFVRDEKSKDKLFYVNNKNVYATYGILTHSATGWNWYPLIDSKTRHIKERPDQGDGMHIYCYDSSIYNARDDRDLSLDLGNIDNLYVLQSYSADTLLDWENGNRDMITVLLSYNGLSNYEKGKTNVALRISEKNEISLWLGAEETKMYAHEDFNNRSFRKSMWPIIYD